MNARARQQVDLQDLEPDDRELVLAFKRGDKGSYQAIHDRYRARVRGVCMRMLDRADDADEAAQETFMKVYTSLPNFNGRYQLGAWMARIATNVCLDHLRSAKRRPSDATDHETMAQLPQASQSEGPEHLLIAADDAKQVRSVLATLSPMHRAAIALREFEGMSYADIAVALGMTEPQVKALLHRARKAFRRSWPSTGLAALLPWNLLARIRKTEILGDAGHATHVAHVAAPGINSVAACSTALQHCGQVLSERFAAVTVALITTTAAAAGADVSSQVAPTPIEVASAGDTDARGKAPSEVHVRRVTRPRRADKEPSAAGMPVSVPSSEPEPPTEEPSPAPTTSPEPDPSNEPKPQPTYGPLNPAMGWERGEAIPATSPTANDMALACGAGTFHQELDSVMHDGAASYPARLVLDVANGTNFDLFVEKDGREVWYDGGAGDIIVVGSGRDTTWGASGSYSAMGNVDPREVGLPLYGRFTLQLSLDCIAAEVISEKLSLTAD